MDTEISIPVHVYQWAPFQNPLSFASVTMFSFYTIIYVTLVVLQLKVDPFLEANPQVFPYFVYDL